MIKNIFLICFIYIISKSDIKGKWSEGFFSFGISFILLFNNSKIFGI